MTKKQRRVVSQIVLGTQSANFLRVGVTSIEQTNQELIPRDGTEIHYPVFQDGRFFCRAFKGIADGQQLVFPERGFLLMRHLGIERADRRIQGHR